MTRITTDVDEAVVVLSSGGLVGLPTETVYGLAADATSAAAVARVFRAKGRPADHPLIVHVAGPDQLDVWARDVSDLARAVTERRWPGPLTVLLRRSPAVLDEVTGGRDTVAVRAPAHPMAHVVLDRLAAEGRALVAPSANRFGRVSPTSAADVVAELGDRVDLVLDGGACTVGIESAIVDLSGDVPRLLRHGRLSLDELRADMPDLVVADASTPAVAPGMLASHYAPAAVVVVLAHDAALSEVRDAVHAELAQGRQVGVLAPSSTAGLPAGVVHLDAGVDTDDYARVLYRRLREADERGLDVVVALAPLDAGAGAAVADRLRRAAHPRGFNP
jgi:L-threonylcarbamoyladenylate synthase